jgi:hypothetical protein
MPLTVSYSFTIPVNTPAGETLLILAEVMRSYDRVNDKVSFVQSRNMGN